MTSAAPQPERWGRLADLPQVGLAVVLALVLLPVSLDSVRAGGLSGSWAGTLAAALVLLHVAVAGAGRWPRPIFAVGSAAMLVLVAAPDLGGPAAASAGGPFTALLLPSSLVFFVLLYAVAAHTAAPWPAAALGVGLVGCLVAWVRLWDATDYDVPMSGAWAWRLFVAAATVGGTLAAWALGRYRATRVAWAAAQVAEREERAAADERRRIAREMHDVVAHSLTVVVSQAEGGRMLVANQPERAAEVLSTISDTGRRALGEMRGLLGVLRDDDAGRLGQPGGAPQPTLDALSDLVERTRAAGVEVRLDESGVRRPLTAVAELAVYRLVQEALTNVAKHAPGAAADVALTWDGDGVRVVVTNPAVDAGDAGALRDGLGRGVIGMRERVEAADGTLDAGRDGAVWRVKARIPHG